MKERKNYEVPSITVISMDEHKDIIQTSAITGYANLLKNIGQAKVTELIDANSKLF